MTPELPSHGEIRKMEQKCNALQVLKFSPIYSEVAVNECVITSLNERKTRKQEDVDKLAERIDRMGYEKTRAVWCTVRDGKYLIFAGGTRLEACRKLNLQTIPAIVYDEISDAEMVRLSHDDNVNDEYHVPVPITDIWAEYSHLSRDLGWTQQKIAEIYGVTRAMVSYRMNMHDLPEDVKDLVNQKLITETQAIELLPLSIDLHFSEWLTTDEIRSRCAQELTKNCVIGGSPMTVTASREHIKKWKSVIEESEGVYDHMKKTTLFDMRKDPPEPIEYDAPAEFLKLLSHREALTLPAIRAAGLEINNMISENLRVYSEYQLTKSKDAAIEGERLRKRQGIMERIIHGDSREVMKRWKYGPIKLILTDPPYGKYYIGTQKKTKPPEVLIGDDKNAVQLIKVAIQTCLPHLAEDSHLIVFCDWQHEPEIRNVLEDLGLAIRGQLIWVKENHSIGDVYHTFAPKHEVMIHAVKGRPIVSPRLPDVFDISRTHESEHPTEKPVELLKQIINSCSVENDTILDPFGGSGSTLIAGLELHRDTYMIEIDRQYVNEAYRRLEQLITSQSDIFNFPMELKSLQKNHSVVPRVDDKPIPESIPQPYPRDISEGAA